MTKINKIYIASGIFLLLIILSKKKVKNMNLTEDEILEKLIPFILKKEGGLTSNLNDPASSFPSPTPQKYHTNKGVTYKTFTTLASKLNYAPTVDNFLKMPNDIWLKIFKQGYYNNVTQPNLTPLLKAYLSLWLWGGWNRKVVTNNQVLNILSSSLSEIDKLQKLMELRKYYFNEIAKANPKLKIYLKGWINNIKAFYNLYVI
jgi:hypothetical protein